MRSRQPDDIPFARVTPSSMPSFLLIDNYDSFTWNLYQALASHRALDEESVLVIRNDAMSLREVLALNSFGVVVSPGPGRPDEAGISLALPRALLARGERGEEAPPFLGVCLGMQCLAQSCGAEVVGAKKLMHGKTSQVRHRGESPLFKGVPNAFVATRYHSLVVERESLPKILRVDAISDDEEEVVMALSHHERALFGVQFHPESVACEHGERIVANFVDFCLDRAKATSSKVA